MKFPLKLTLLAGLTVLITGCKLAVIVVEGGKVQSNDSGTCIAGNVCVVNVDEPLFSDVFTASPDEDWYFEKWQSGDGFHCENSVYPSCYLSFNGHEESEVVREIVDSSETFYIMPVFRLKSNMSKVKVKDKEWLQPSLFLNFTYEEVAAVCPPPSLVCTGSLPGNSVDLTGYHWATWSEVSALFNFYGLEPKMTYTPQHVQMQGAKEGHSFFEDFKYIRSFKGAHKGMPYQSIDLSGMLSRPAPSKLDNPWVWKGPNAASVSLQTGFREEPDYSNWSNTTMAIDTENIGAWFWRPVEN